MDTSFRAWAIKQHDIVCNQKYNEDLPYSFHLKAVESNVEKYKHLLSREVNFENDYLHEYDKAKGGAIGHDLIEDARVTYNDINNFVGESIADIIYCLTDEKGKNRSERHSETYYTELKKNEIAVFVKLCDILANLKFGLLTNSRMFGMYKKEFPKLKEKLYIEKYDELFTDIENILKL